jgi:hypothetical protein
MLHFCVIPLEHHQDEDFVAEKDDSGSPTDDSDEDGSDASLSGEEKEVTKFSVTKFHNNLFTLN